MAPFTNIPLSPAELSYLYTSLAQQPCVRPDGRSTSQFRPLIAESGILPGANGSARICFVDGTEAVVGVKAEVEKTFTTTAAQPHDKVANPVDNWRCESNGSERASWIEMTIEIPGMRDDDTLPVFLAAMLTEALLADGELASRLWINSRFHWKLYIDVLLLSQPLSYPLPLLSLTTHLSLLSTRLPALVSDKEEDPFFNDDWEASTFLYPGRSRDDLQDVKQDKPPITLLVMSAGDNIIFDPNREELAVAEAVMAISIGQTSTGGLEVVALRAIDTPARLTGAGVPRSLDTTSGTNPSVSHSYAQSLREKDEGQTVWRPPRGGITRAMIARMISLAVEDGGVGEEVMEGLAGVKT